MSSYRDALAAAGLSPVEVDYAVARFAATGDRITAVELETAPEIGPAELKYMELGETACRFPAPGPARIGERCHRLAGHPGPHITPNGRAWIQVTS